MKNVVQSEKLQKVLAKYGIGSRREMEQWILDGKITVNNKIATLGLRVKDNDKIFVKGKSLQLYGKPLSRPRVILYNKREGEVCTRSDEKDRKTVFDALPKLQKSRWIMVGRLDLNTTGLLLFTTDGTLAHRLMHPSYEVKREYAVRTLGELTEENIKNLTEGVKLDDGIAKFDFLKFEGGEGVNKWYKVGLREGRNKEVRRLIESQDIKVSRLIRVSFANINLPKVLKLGNACEISSIEVNYLRKLVKLPKFDFPKKLDLNEKNKLRKVKTI